VRRPRRFALRVIVGADLIGIDDEAGDAEQRAKGAQRLDKNKRGFALPETLEDVDSGIGLRSESADAAVADGHAVGEHHIAVIGLERQPVFVRHAQHAQIDALAEAGESTLAQTVGKTSRARAASAAMAASRHASAMGRGSRLIDCSGVMTCATTFAGALRNARRVTTRLTGARHRDVDHRDAPRSHAIGTSALS
jgi:hypothetical protein